jgi:hypothetical protein
MIDAQVQWKGGLSTFSASTSVLHAIRGGIAGALGIPMAHIAQVTSTHSAQQKIFDPLKT